MSTEENTPMQAQPASTFSKGRFAAVSGTALAVVAALAFYATQSAQ